MTGGAIQKRWLSGASFAGMFLFGVVMAVLGAALPLLAGSLRFDLAQAGNLFLGMNFAMLTCMLALGPLMDRFGIKLGLAAGALLTAAALARIATAGDYGDVLAGVALLGLGGGALNGSTNTLVADLHEDPRKKSSALNILGIFFGFGALFIPFFIGSLVEALGLARILFIAAGLSLALAAVVFSLGFPAAKAAQSLQLAEAARLARDPLVLLLGFLLFFKSGNEFTAGGYISTFLARELGSSIPAASYLLAAYWGAIMAARIVLSRLVLKMKGSTVVLACAALAAAGSALLVASESLAAAAIAVVLIGLGFSGVYPVTFAFAGTRFAERSGTAFGILFAIALVGGMAAPWAAGQISAGYGLRRGLVILIANAAMIFLLQLLVIRADRRRPVG